MDGPSLLADGAEPDAVHLRHVVRGVVGGGQLGVVAGRLVIVALEVVVVVVVATLEICRHTSDLVTQLILLATYAAAAPFVRPSFLFLACPPSSTILVDAAAQTLDRDRGHISPKPPSASVQVDISSFSPLLHVNLILMSHSSAFYQSFLTRILVYLGGRYVIALRLHDQSG